MNFIFFEVSGTVCQVLIDAGFENLKVHSDHVRADSPTGWTLQNINTYNSFLVDSAGNLRAELIKRLDCAGWYIIPRTPFEIIRIGGDGEGVVLHLNKIVYRGIKPGTWLDENYPGWSQNPPKYWERN